MLADLAKAYHTIENPQLIRRASLLARFCPIICSSSCRSTASLSRGPTDDHPAYLQFRCVADLT
jgi:hypothetical protein